jgi:hypothetical protein
MVKGNAQQFLEQLCNDAAFRAQYRASGTGSGLDTLDFALTKGFVFTMSELRQALRTFPEHSVIYQMCEMLKIPREPRPAQTA